MVKYPVYILTIKNNKIKGVVQMFDVKLANACLAVDKRIPSADVDAKLGASVPTVPLSPVRFCPSERVASFSANCKDLGITFPNVCDVWAKYSN